MHLATRFNGAFPSAGIGKSREVYLGDEFEDMKVEFSLVLLFGEGEYLGNLRESCTFGDFSCGKLLDRRQ